MNMGEQLVLYREEDILEEIVGEIRDEFDADEVASVPESKRKSLYFGF